MGAMRDSSEEDKEQQARIALLDYFGSLARHWATVLLATVVAFYSVWQIRKYVDYWVFTFALTITVAGGVYAFIRMITHGKYCELALDNKVRPLEKGTHVTRMLRGMHRSMRKRLVWKLPIWRLLDSLGGFGGFCYWAFISICAWFALASLWTLSYFPVNAWENWLTDALQHRQVVVTVILAIAVGIFLSTLLFISIPPKIYAEESETPEP